jgi:proteasome lid subunit RPN8/RPN11
MSAAPATWRIPRSVLDSTARVLASGQHEVFALWTAKRTEAIPACVVSRLVVPKQTPESSIFGVSVRIDGDELARIVFENHALGEKSVVQLHTHPGSSVEMSLLDREREVVRHEGGLSIIVPRYGRDGLDDFPGVSVYERRGNVWCCWGPGEAARRLLIT